MEENQKPTYTLIWKRFWTRDLWVSVCFLVSLLIIICEHIDKWAFLNFVETVVFYLEEGTILYTLAVSYISGVFVYFLTIVLPETRKNKSIYVEICCLLRELEDEFTSLRLDLEVEDWCSSDKAIDAAVQTVKYYNKQDCGFYKLQFCSKILEDLAQTFDNLTSVIQLYFSILSKEELDAIVRIRRCKIAYMVKYKYGIENVLNENEVRNYFMELAQLNKDVAQLHKIMKKIIYK